ncbi:UDP-3-O-(3-hydroxymyristoyl)glucosamine N-acyltransferase [Piscirickettsia litoralis]|uniref:UDP-3-O-acylglucosamine N-acyltransferase n=1 Tax=Piscirickettsia litoralis TaxID=1891921 RepID=A0ABX3A7F8_9GAMM|nr:UDP-3-O-(3-hydroxymyristoyl)glucosamine N-acyltransferase [Piscirickettsia litoralis]ODN43641.1 UDP-3-O-(3-hydroxymyristoyl)glucosamine N-acyltransferase [Piscirickettsia litoralis]
MTKSFLATEVATHVGGKLCGSDVTLTEINGITSAGPGSLTFLTDAKYAATLPQSQASCIFVKSAAGLEVGPKTSLIEVADVYVAHAKAMALFYPLPEVKPGCHVSAVIAETAEIDPSAEIGPNVVIEAGAVIGANCKIGAGCFIGEHSQLGRDCRLMANVTVCHDVVLGDRVMVHSATVIGSDGFGNANDKGRWVKINHIGRVVVENDVEIGAGTAIDRGVLGDTVIGEGARLDNLIQVAHNVSIGAHTAIAGSVGIAGSATIGKYCMIGGGTGIAGHVKIHDGCIVTGMTMVTKSIRRPGVYSSGIPVKPQKVWQKNVARFNRSEELAKRVSVLAKTTQRVN